MNANSTNYFSTFGKKDYIFNTESPSTPKFSDCKLIKLDGLSLTECIDQFKLRLDTSNFKKSENHIDTDQHKELFSK